MFVLVPYFFVLFVVVPLNDRIRMSYLHFGEPAYWEERYKLEQQKNFEFRLFDWYCRFDEVYPMIESVIDPALPHKVLIIGVGRSNVIDVLYKKG